MTTVSISTRLDSKLVSRLRRLSERERASLSQLVERYLEEAVRAEELPGIVFRSGPAGRRAGLVGGPDVWEVVRDLQAAEAAGSEDPALTVLASTDLREDQVQLALSYYALHTAEIDSRIADELALVRRLAPGA